MGRVALFQWLDALAEKNFQQFSSLNELVSELGPKPVWRDKLPRRSRSLEYQKPTSRDRRTFRGVNEHPGGRGADVRR